MIHREVDAAQPLAAQGLTAQTLLCVRDDLPVNDGEHERYTRAMRKVSQASAMLRVQGGAALARATTTPRQSELEAKFDSVRWRSVFKAVLEPFPPFNVVERLLGGGCAGTRVVVGWNAANDSIVRERCAASQQACGARQLVLTGRRMSGSVTEEASFLELDPDGHFGSEEASALIAHMTSVGIEAPFLLVLVSRGYLSRRLGQCMRVHLPQGVSYFPCPPSDLRAVCKEELPSFSARVFEEVRRLVELGVELKTDSVQALDKLSPEWRSKGSGGSEVGPHGKWRDAFHVLCEPFPSFLELSAVLENMQTLGHTAYVIGWNAAHDRGVRERLPNILVVAGDVHQVLTSTHRRKTVELQDNQSFLHVDTDEACDMCGALVNHLARIGASPPCVLFIVSRAFLSRRLAFSLRRLLPSGYHCFMCPPADADAACREEIPLFEAQVFDETRRLLNLDGFLDLHHVDLLNAL